MMKALSQGATVVCATHDPALARATGARTIHLGRAWDEDDPASAPQPSA